MEENAEHHNWAHATLSTVIVAAVTIFVLACFVKLHKGLKAVGHLPGMRVPFGPIALPSVILPTTWWNPGTYFNWNRRFELYETLGQHTFSVVPFMAGVPVIYTRDAEIGKQAVSAGYLSSFTKSEFACLALNLWGTNVVTSDGEVWRRHRRIMGPGFNARNYELVWETTVQTYKDMINDENWKERDVVEVPVIQKFTFKLALLVIATCGFGLDFSWDTPPMAQDGSMSVQEALHLVSDNVVFIVSAPKLLWMLPFSSIQRLSTARRTLEKFMVEHVAERKAQVKEDLLAGAESDKDVFTVMVRANEMEGKLNLDDSELMGNVFGMLVAGQETTAYTLAAALGYLSLQPKLQDEIHDQVVSVVGLDREPSFADCDKLDKALYAFFETLRMIPPGSILLRESKDDTILKLPNAAGELAPVAIPKGVYFILDMIGLHYDPKLYPEPGKFKPSRWSGVSNESDRFTAFGIGHRACIGRKFAITEAVCFLSLVMRDWRAEPLLRNGETPEAWEKRVMQVQLLMTLGVLDVPVKFTRRNK